MPLLGFNPGVPSNTPGIVTDCDNFIPYESGMEAAPSMASVSASVVAAAVTGAATVTKLNGTNRTFVGTDTKLYELSSGAWVDVSQSASAYVSGSIWTFAQFGDATLASNYGNVIQASSTASFSAIVGAPKAKIIETVVTSGGGFAFAFNTNDASYGVSPDRWWCSAINDHTDWSVQTATQCTTGRLLGAGGEIVAAKRLGADSIVAYKPESCYRGRYVGGSVVWAFDEYDIGCVGLRAVANLGFAHFVVTKDGFWLFDGNRPVQIAADSVRDWFVNNYTPGSLGKTEVVYEKEKNRVWVFFPYSGSTTLNRALVYHTITQQWGLWSGEVETVLNHIGSPTTIDGSTGTMDGQFDSYDSRYWESATRSLALFDDTHRMVTLTGTPGESYFTTADAGDMSKSSRLTEAYVAYAFRPLTAACTGYQSFSLGGPEIVGPTVSAHDEIGSPGISGRFTLRQSARYHRMRFDFTGPVRVVEYAAKITPAGSR